ncbi:MAG: glycosyltransferase [Aestuariivita sp.]|uniref:glycosyltransferase n=1 Tax=Aestuariivita sp. TaxID=1872407 RepID=UPI003BAFC8AF
MHIVHLLTRLLRAGSEENTVETCRWQVAAGHRVTLVHGDGFDPWWDRNLPAGVTRICLPQMVHPPHPIADIRAIVLLRALYRKLQPDVIHTHQSKAGVLGRLAALAVPQAVVVHGIHIVPFEGVSAAQRAIYIAAERAAGRRTDLFMSVSKAVGDAYVAAGVAREDQIHCVRSGMDLTRFRDACVPADWRALLRLGAGQPVPKVAVMMAALEPRKRHVAFLRAFSDVAREACDIRLFLAGSGPEEARIRAEIRNLGLGHQVVMCGHRSDPEAMFALADVSVLTSEREGLPRVAVQSMAAGCPMVATALPGLGELLEDGRNCCIVAPDDLAGAAGQMMALLRDDLRLHALKQAALSTDVSAWSLGTLGARTTALYGVPMGRRAAA